MSDHDYHHFSQMMIVIGINFFLLFALCIITSLTLHTAIPEKLGKTKLLLGLLGFVMFIFMIVTYSLWMVFNCIRMLGVK